MSNEHVKMEVRDLRKGGWIWADKQVLFSPHVPDSAFRVYCALGSYAGNHDQRSWPSHATLGQSINTSKSTVIRALKLLESVGLIRIDRRSGTSNLYTLLPVTDITPVKVTKEQSPHHRLVGFFYDTCNRARNVKPMFSAKDTKRLKDVLGMGIMPVDSIEQMMLYFLASPRWSKFAPSLSVFFSAGVFNGLANDMRRGGDFWRDIEQYTTTVLGSREPVVQKAQVRNIEAMAQELSNKFAIKSDMGV